MSQYILPEQWRNSTADDGLWLHVSKNKAAKSKKPNEPRCACGKRAFYMCAFKEQKGHFWLCHSCKTTAPHGLIVL